MQSVVCNRHIPQGRHDILLLRKVTPTYGKRDGNDDVKCRPVFCRGILNAFKLSRNSNALQSPQLNSTQVILAGAPSAMREKGGSEVKKLRNTSISGCTVPGPSISTPQATSSLSQIQWSTRLPNHDVFYNYTVLMPFQMPMNSKIANAP